MKARRDMGYQQAGILNKDKDQTAQGNVGGINPKKELYPTVSRKNQHGQTRPNQSLLLSNTGKVPRVSGPLTPGFGSGNPKFRTGAPGDGCDEKAGFKQCPDSIGFAG